ncbi:AAA family ATPase [Pedobacter sp. ASV1-7]|uniref:AAA family ATPase n=1 Tax=Pedobacter sp. ASV1-7 TaxID=3145237 RepID=UPI0032E89D16
MAFITKENILDKSQGGLLFFKLFIPGLDLKKGTHFRLKNPLYHDKNPSMALYCKDDRWFFHDYGAVEYKGDVFKFASFYYGLDLQSDFRQILQLMDEDLENLEIKPLDLNSEIIYNNNNNLKSFELICTRSYGDFTSEELSFFNQYGITKATIEAQNVLAIDKYLTGGERGRFITRPANSIWFGYIGKDHAKIYCPSPEKRFWYLGTKPKNHYFGSQLDYCGTGTNVFITGGEKDVLSLISNGYLAICLNSETADIPEELLKSFYRFRLTPILLYDIDDTGTTAAQKLSSKHDIKMLKLPEELKNRGGKDVADFFKFGFTATDLDNIEPVFYEELISENKLEKTSINAALRTAQQRLEDAKNLPEIKMLLDVFMHSGELAILFGDTGIGKSVLAVCIADALSKGESLLGLQNQCIPQKVIYYDFELSDKQFEKRYSDDCGNPYQFSENFYTDSIDFSELTSPNRKIKFEHLLIDRFKKNIIDIGANIIIIDNITFLSTQTSQDGQVAMEIMKLLKQMKEDLQVTVLVLAHTPKRPPSEGIMINHLAGSKHLSNFADSVFAIGSSKNDKGFRYMKQVKPSRSGELKYDDSNVLKCELIKESDFLTFDFIEFCDEKSLLSVSQDAESEEELRSEAITLRDSGLTIRDIGLKLGISKSKIGRWLQEAKQ